MNRRAYGSPLELARLRLVVGIGSPAARCRGLARLRLVLGDWLACGSPFPGGDAIKQKAANAAIFVIYADLLQVNLSRSA